MRVLIIDNYDSFTFNLYQYIGEILSAKLGEHFDLRVVRNNQIDMAGIQAFNPERLVISPGPGSPDDKHYFGVCAEAIQEFGKKIPVLGVCLGMQGICHVFGGKIVKAMVPMHGKSSPIVHNGEGLFRNIPQGLDIMRYHSLIAEIDSFPNCLEITAYIQGHDGAAFEAGNPFAAEIMALRHREFPIQGIQFHPESFASEGGRDMIENFLFS